MAFVYHSYVLLCQLNVLVRHSYVTLTYLYVTRMSLECTFASSVCYSHVFLCHWNVTHMSLYVILTSLLYTGVSSVYSHVTSKYLYVVYMSIVCGFTMNQFKYSFSLPLLEMIHIKSSMLKVWPNISEDKTVVKWLANGIILDRTKVKYCTRKIRQKQLLKDVV